MQLRQFEPVHDCVAYSKHGIAIGACTATEFHATDNNDTVDLSEIETATCSILRARSLRHICLDCSLQGSFDFECLNDIENNTTTKTNIETAGFTVA
ncbi:MAG: hypothetical protein J0M00_04025 [Burkholderiales bacterium]|nr:hypothetical protein [Burkholderiales bacterium]